MNRRATVETVFKVNRINVIRVRENNVDSKVVRFYYARVLWSGEVFTGRVQHV